MGHSRRRPGAARFGGLAGLALLLATALPSPRPSTADEEDVALRRAAEWRRALASLVASDQRFDARALAALDRQLPSFTPEALEAQAELDEVDQLPDAQGDRVRHALRALSYDRRIGSRLDRGPAIALLLGSSEEASWSRALMELCREPFGERLGAVAESLSTDSRGPMRAMAGRMAVYLTAFCGGRGSAWGAKLRTEWDPTPLVRRIAKRLLDDRNPAVACAFAMSDAYALEDVQVVDWLTDRLNDERQTPRVKHGLWLTQERTVGDACFDRLDAEFRFYRETRRQMTEVDLREPPLRRVKTLPNGRTPDAISRWWSEVRDQWSFTPDGEAWEPVLDHLVVVRAGESTRIETPRGAVRVRCTEYAEHHHTGQPELSAHVEVDEADAIHLDLGNPQHHLGYVARSTATGGVGWITGSLIYAPSTADGVRMRVRLYVASSIGQERVPR